MSRFPKISETFILYEILELERNGIPVEVFSLLREYQQIEHPEAKEVVKRAHFHPFISLSIIKAVFYFLLRSPYTCLKILWEVLSGTFGSINFFFGAICIFPKSTFFAYEMKRQGVTHIHAHFANHPTVAALIIHRLTGIPFSFTAHGHDIHIDLRMLDRKVEAAAFVVTVSSYNKELITEKCGNDKRDKIFIIHCGVDNEIFFPTPKNIHNKSFRILCVASFEEVKGHKYLIEACGLLHKQGFNFECHLVGDGPLRKQVGFEIKKSGLEDKIVIHGVLERIDVVKQMRSADIFVLPSVHTKRGNREGIPVALMEAMSVALPVLSTELSGIPELVENGITGILVTPRDSVSLADGMQRLLSDDQLRTKMGRKGREKVLRDFDLKTNTAKLTKLFYNSK
jgi:colanic acid/amylovoran biosynthesis glycosyltransferase